jgi:hypothetical protein
MIEKVNKKNNKIKNKVNKAVKTKTNLKIKGKDSSSSIKAKKIKVSSEKRILKVKDKIVPAEVAFYCFDGRVYYCLRELCNGLNEMSQDTFNFHVNHKKNDFYNWIKHTFQNDKLSKLIHKSKKPKTMMKIIEKSLL